MVTDAIDLKQRKVFIRRMALSLVFEGPLGCAYYSLTAFRELVVGEVA